MANYPTWFPLLPLALAAPAALAQTEDPFEDFSFEQVEQIVKTEHPTDLAQVLAALPKSFLSSYTLVQDSQSIQEASPASPRAIVFGKTAKFILAFNGDPTQRGYERLEMLQFRDETQRFELREVTFGKDGAVVSEKNPKRCVACHGETPHPIWQSYSRWPGVFGSADDFLEGMSDEKPFEAFTTAAPAHPRYKFLNALTDISDHWPYRSYKINTGPFGEYHVYRANDRFGRLLGGRGASSAAALVEASPFYRDHRNAVLYHFLRCDLDKTPDTLRPAAERLFRSRFPADKFPRLYQNLAGITNPRYQTTLMLEKLITDSDVLTWNFVLLFGAQGARFSPDGFTWDGEKYDAPRGLSEIDDLLAVRLFEKQVEREPALAPYFKPVSAVENYDGINGESRKMNLTEWGIDKLYDSVNRFMDYRLARTSCVGIETQAMRELAR